MTSTRERVLTEGMRLFAERGYDSTSVAQIEAAAGLSPGSGGLYKHFRSKRALLAAGLERLLSDDQELSEALDHAEHTDLTGRLIAVARAGLRRMDQGQDLSRLLFRGLDAFPDLLERFGEGEIVRIHQRTVDLLTDLAADRDADVDWPAVALVLQGAVAHYWLLTDLFGDHPAGVDEDRYVAAVAALAVGLIRTPGNAQAGARARTSGRQLEEER